MTKLTLRDLFAVVTIVALALGWWLDHRKMQLRSNMMAEEMEAMAGEMKYLRHEQQFFVGMAEEVRLLRGQQQMFKSMVEGMGYNVHFFENGLRLSPIPSSQHP